MSLRAITITAIVIKGALGVSAARSAPVTWKPIVIRRQGKFAVGGTNQTAPGTFINNAPTAAGQSFHRDHLYAFYQVPEQPMPLPIVMLHGAYLSGRSWETTYDGRRGFQTIFLPRHFPVYIVDQPRREQRRRDDDRAAAERSALCRSVPHRAMAKILRWRAI